MTIVVTGDNATKVDVSVNDVQFGTLNISAHGSYEQMNIALRMFRWM